MLLPRITDCIADRWMICTVQAIAAAMASLYVTFQSLRKSTTAVGTGTWVEVGIQRQEGSSIEAESVNR